MIHHLQTSKPPSVSSVKELRDHLASFLTDQERARATIRSNGETVQIVINGDGLFLCKIARNLTEKGFFE